MLSPSSTGLILLAGVVCGVACASGAAAPDAATPASPAPAALAPAANGSPASQPSDAPEAAGSAAPGGADGAPIAAPVPAAPAPLPTGTRVLHIGDSMAGALGVELNRQLKEQGVKASLRAETASYIPTWAWGDTLPQALAQLEPDLVIVTLGMNELQIADPTQRAKSIRRLVERIGARPCVWISPPPLASGTNDLVAVIRENCAPCAFMNTDEVYPDMPRLGDKVHPTMPARAEWARRVIEWLAAHREPSETQPWALRQES